MIKYGLVMAEDFFGEEFIILTNELPKNYKGTLLYKCKDVDKKIKELKERLKDE